MPQRSHNVMPTSPNPLLCCVHSIIGSSPQLAAGLLHYWRVLNTGKKRRHQQECDQQQQQQQQLDQQQRQPHLARQQSHDYDEPAVETPYQVSLHSCDFHSHRPAMIAMSAWSCKHPCNASGASMQIPQPLRHRTAILLSETARPAPHPALRHDTQHPSPPLPASPATLAPSQSPRMCPTLHNAGQGTASAKAQSPCPCPIQVSVPQAQQLQPGATESLSAFLSPLNPQLPGQPSISELFDASYRQTFGHSPPQSPTRHRRVMSDLGAAGSHSSSPSPQPYGHSCSHADLVQVRAICRAYVRVQELQPTWVLHAISLGPGIL